MVIASIRPVGLVVMIDVEGLLLVQQTEGHVLY